MTAAALVMVGGLVAWLAWEVRALRRARPREEPAREEAPPASEARLVGTARSRVRARARRR